MKIVKVVLIFILITLLTQIGGIIYLVSKLLFKSLNWNKLSPKKEIIKRWTFHIAIYMIFTFFVVPPIAKIFGRVPLPFYSNNLIGPRTIWTVILNRHYVRPQLRETVLTIALQQSKKWPGIHINYFDASHPFLKGYPLIPHLSHNDGKKLDIGLVYNDSDTEKLSKNTPSAIGYGISEEPLPGEYDRPAECARISNNWMYSFVKNIYPQEGKRKFIFNQVVTANLITSFADHTNVQKIFLEPHLTTRLRLYSSKIRMVQCGSVRHDDHFHIQIK